MAESKLRQESAYDSASRDSDEGVLSKILGELARLKNSNDDLRGRVHRLESQAGRGLVHPRDYIDLASGQGG